MIHLFLVPLPYLVSNQFRSAVTPSPAVVSPFFLAAVSCFFSGGGFPLLSGGGVSLLLSIYVTVVALFSFIFLNFRLPVFFSSNYGNGGGVSFLLRKLYGCSGFSFAQSVFDEDIGADQRLGIAKLPLVDLQPEVEKEIQLRLQPSLDMLKVKDKKDRGTVTIKARYHALTKEEQDAALAEEKKMLEEKEKQRDEGTINSTMDAVQ